MASYPPCGNDRADGLNGNPGTPTPDDAVVYQPAPTFLEELPESPQIEFGEHNTYVHSFKTDEANAYEILGGTPRGTILVDSEGSQYKVLTTQLDFQKGNFCVVRITQESVLTPPEDEFHVESVEFNPSIFLHPRYQTVINYDAPPDDEAAEQNITGPQIINWITNAVDGSSQSQQNQWGQFINSTNITDPDVLSLAKELVTKLRRGEDTYYLSGWRVYWSQYFNLPQPLNPGGYIEDPVAEGQLPPYFWSADGTPDGDNTLISLAQQVNPIIYPPPTDLAGTISWLRQADTVEYQRVWFKVVHSWLGGPNGTWDNDIYPMAEGNLG